LTGILQHGIMGVRLGDSRPETREDLAMNDNVIDIREDLLCRLADLDPEIAEQMRESNASIEEIKVWLPEDESDEH